MSDSTLFIVRIWRQFAGSFRASVRKVDDEEARLFTTPEDIARFFDATAERVDDPAAGKRNEG